MKSSEHTHCCHMGFGILLALFGVFFLVANLSPDRMAILCFWPIFLIAAGLFKAGIGYFCNFRS